MKIRLFTLVAVFCFVVSGYAQDYSLFIKRTLISGQDTLHYRILYPENYNANKEYPLILFLHGIGERGTDNEKQLVNFAGFFLKDNIRKKTQSIVIFPQCPENAYWSDFSFNIDSVRRKVDIRYSFGKNPTVPSKLVKLLADRLVTSHIADPARLYIGGLSLGGFGTYDFIERYPRYFIAAFPICGGGDTSFASQIAKNTSVWIFHGGADPVVTVNYSRQFYKALKKYGAHVKYSEYAGVGHNSWDNAALEPGLIEWIQEKKKIKPSSTK